MFHGMRYVYTVYKEGSFTAAARKLFISQPTLSANVKHVENLVGYPLFDRSTKPIKLTEYGEKYIETAEKILQAEEAFTDFLNDRETLHAGTLTLGGTSLYSSWIFPPLITAFTKRYPHVTVNLMEANTSELTEMLKKGQVDLILENAVLPDELYDRSTYRTEYLLLSVPADLTVNETLKKYQIPSALIKDESYLRSGIPAVPLTAFKKEPFILLKPGNYTRQMADELFERSKMKPDIVFEPDQQMTAYNITCSGLGCSFIGDTLIRSVPDSERAVYYHLPFEESCRELSFYWRAGRFHTKVMAQFLSEYCGI